MLRRLLYLNFRIVHRFNRWLRNRFTPAGILVLSCLLAAGVFGIDLRHTVSYQLFTLILSIVLVSLVSSLRFRDKFRISRDLPEFGTVGQELQYTIRITNNNHRHNSDLVLIDQTESPFPGFAEYINSWDPQDRDRNWFDRKIGYPRLMGIMRKKRGAVIDPLILDNIGPGKTATVRTSLKPLRRGYIRFKEILVGKPDPFGIYRAIRKIRQKQSLLVLPKTYRIPSLHLFGHRKYQHGGITQASAVGDSQEFLSLRDYRPGDPLRSIHWRSFAKLGKPVVKEFQDEFFVRQGMLLDTWLDNKPEIIFEEAVSIAASFALTSFDNDSLLDLLFVGSESYRFTSGRGLAQPENMLEILACVETCHEPPFEIMTNLVIETCAENSGLICIFLDWDTNRQELVSKAMGLGIPVYVFVVTTDEDTQTMDRGPLSVFPDRFYPVSVHNVQAVLDSVKI